MKRRNKNEERICTLAGIAVFNLCSHYRSFLNGKFRGRRMANAGLCLPWFIDEPTAPGCSQAQNHLFLDPVPRCQGGLKEEMNPLYAQGEAVELYPRLFREKAGAPDSVSECRREIEQCDRREQKLLDSQEIPFADSLNPDPCFQVTERELDAIALQV